jgi:hypothetical protein
MTRAIIYLTVAFAAGAAGWWAAGAFVARVGMSDAVRIVATGGLFLMAATVFGYTVRQVAAGRWRP